MIARPKTIEPNGCQSKKQLATMVSSFTAVVILCLHYQLVWSGMQKLTG